MDLNQKSLPRRVYLRERYELLEPLYELELALEHTNTRMSIKTLSEARKYQYEVSHRLLHNELLPHERRVLEYAQERAQRLVWDKMFEEGEL